MMQVAGGSGREGDVSYRGRWADRRVAAGLLMMLALLVVVVVPNVIGRSTKGSAVAVPVPEPPAVGACIAESFDPNLSWGQDGAEDTESRYPELGVGDCASTHYGEVVAVIAEPAEVTMVENSSGGSTVADDNWDTCYRAASAFLGWQVDDSPDAQLFGVWWPVAEVNAVPLGPTAQQRAAGAHWLACAAYLMPDPSMSVGPASPVRFQGTLRDAIFTGVGRDYLGVCPNGVDWYDTSSTGCAAPHRSEVFGWGRLDREASRATLTATCARLVAQATANGGLVSGNEFEVAVQAFDDEGKSVPGTTLPASTQIQCGLTTVDGRFLTGSLRAIGSGPIPWA